MDYQGIGMISCFLLMAGGITYNIMNRSAAQPSPTLEAKEQ